MTIWWVIDYDNITNSLAEKPYGENRSVFVFQVYILFLMFFFNGTKN